MDEMLKSIHEKLDTISKKYDQDMNERFENSEKAETLLRFITDTIETCAPGKIEAQRYGNAHNPAVYDYPFVTILAVSTNPMVTLAAWRINTGGSVPPEITTEDILFAINRGIEKMPSF